MGVAPQGILLHGREVVVESDGGQGFLLIYNMYSLPLDTCGRVKLY